MSVDLAKIMLGKADFTFSWITQTSFVCFGSWLHALKERVERCPRCLKGQTGDVMKKMLFIAVPPLLLLVFAAAGGAMAQQQKKADSSRASERVGNVRRRQIRKSNRRRVRRPRTRSPVAREDDWRTNAFAGS